MKKTSYIIISLAILPLAIVFISPFLMSLFYSPSDSLYPDYKIELSKDMSVTKMPAFDNIDINIENFGNTDYLEVVVRKADTYRISIPDNIKDFFSVTTEYGILTIEIENNDGSYHYLDGDTLMIIETPAFVSLKLNDLNNLRMQGFDCEKAKIDFDRDIYLENCHFGTLNIYDAGGLFLDNSRIGRTDIIAEAYLKVGTEASAIDSMFVSTSYDRLNFSYAKANIGYMQIQPDGRTIELALHEPLTIKNEDYGHND